MQVIKHLERDDIDGNRGMIEFEFIMNEDDIRRIDQTFSLESHNHQDKVFYSTVCDDGKFYTMVVNKDYEVLEWY